MSDKKLILTALQAMQKAIQYVPKERKQQLNYDIVSYDGLLDEIRDHALANGLMLMPVKCHQTNCSPYERKGRSYNGQAPSDVHMKYDSYVFDFKLWHVSGESLDISTPAVGVDEFDKGPGKAMTYAAKYAWLQVLMLKRGDDPDNHPQQGQQQYQHNRNQNAQQPHQGHNYPQQGQYSQNQQRPPQQGYQGQQQYPQQQNNFNPPPQQRPPQNQPAVMTDNPSTWPPDWVNVLNKVKEHTSSTSTIEAMPNFDIMQNLRQISQEISANNCPKVIHDRIMLQASCQLLDSAMKSTNSNVSTKAVNDVNVNWNEFRVWAGEKAANIQNTLSNWVPF